MRTAIEKSISDEVEQALLAADAIPTYPRKLTGGADFIWQVGGNWQLAAAPAG